MTETSKRVGVFVGAGMLIAAAALSAHAASQNTSADPGSFIAQAGGQGLQGGPGGPGFRRGRPGGPGGPGDPGGTRTNDGARHGARRGPGDD